MAYSLDEITIRTRNSVEGFEKINQIWNDIASGRIPLLFNSEGVHRKGHVPVSRYSNYESDYTGWYDLSIISANAELFARLEEEVKKGKYIKVENSNEISIDECVVEAWRQIWDLSCAGKIKRAYTTDYECSTPKEYSPDGLYHCKLYISVKD